jgi:ion channel
VRNHRAILVFVLALSISLDTVFGVAFAYAQGVSVWDGLYFATTTGSTVGYGDITPRGWLPHLIAVAMMLLVIPLFSSVFALFSTALTTEHIDFRHYEMKRHVEAHNGGRSGDPGVDSGAGGGERGPAADGLGGDPGLPPQPADVPGPADPAGGPV